MRRTTIPLMMVAVLALCAAPAAYAQEQGGQYPGGPPSGGPAEWPPPEYGDFDYWQKLAIHHFRGQVVAVDAEAGTIEADVVHMRVHRGSGSYTESHSGDSEPERPVLERATFVTDEDTHIARNGQPASLGDIQPGDFADVAILAPYDASKEEVLATPALGVAAYERFALYGFAGRVRAVDPEAGTIALRVRYATPPARRLLGRPRSQTLTFGTSDATVVIVDGERSSLEALSQGDLAGVGIRGRRGATLEEVLATPAAFVVGMTEPRRASARHFKRLGRRAAKRARSLR